MEEISKPDKRTFWKASFGDLVHEGFTEVNQVTTTGLPVFEHNVGASTIFPPLPSTGTLTEGEIYSYNDNMVEVRQTHERTIYPPEDTPALFTVYRATTENMDWIANEEVVIGDTRIYNDITYKCLQSHVTQQDWTPPLTIGVLWSVVSEGNAWAPGQSYIINQEVTYEGHTYKCLQAHTSLVGWEPPNVPALWQLIS